MLESDVSVVPANEASWDDLQAVFGRGAAAKCQCQRIKLGDRAWFDMPVEERTHRLREETDCGNPEADGTSGMVAYLDGEPVGWVAVEPRANYRRLRGSSVPWAGRTEDPDDPDVWAIVCFAIRPGYRGQGLTRPLTTAAVQYAQAHGAMAVEGYPMIPKPGQAVSWGEMNVGSRNTFVAAGFREVSHPTTRRVVMRLDLSSAGPANTVVAAPLTGIEWSGDAADVSGNGLTLGEVMAHKRRAAFAVMALSGLLALAGCSARASGGESIEPSIGPVPQLLDASRLRLPAEDYLLTTQQGDRLGAANLVLIRRCMARFGFTYVVTPVNSSDYGPVSLTDRRYGITDARLAQTYGYGLGDRDPARQPKPKPPKIGPVGENVLSGSGRSVIKGQPVPEGGCIGEADRALNQAVPAGVDARRGNSLQLASFEASKADSRVRAVFAAWSACMSESGYHYADPLESAGDPAFTPPANAHQVAVALADIACKSKTNLVGIWFTVEVAYEKRVIDADQAALDKVKAAIAARDRMAISVLN